MSNNNAKIKCITPQTSPYLKKGFYDDIIKAYDILRSNGNENHTADELCQLNEIMDNLIHHNRDSIQPYHVFDQCLDLFEAEFASPEDSSIWYKSIQQGFKKVHTENQDSIESKLFIESKIKWSLLNCKENTQFNKKSIPQFVAIKEGEEEPVVEDINVAKQQILSLYTQNLKYIESLLKNDNETKLTLLQNKESGDYLLNELSQDYGIGPSINNTSKEKILGTTITSCYSPGYVQGLQRNPIGLTKMVMVMKGTLILCATNTMNEEESIKFQHKTLGHNETCPNFTYHQTKLIKTEKVQYIPELISFANKLNQEHLNGHKGCLYVSLLRPGNIAIIRGDTYYFTFSPTNEYTWTKSTLFAPPDSITQLRQSLTCHHSFYNILSMRNEPCSICFGAVQKEYFSDFLCDEERIQFTPIEKQQGLLKLAKKKSENMKQTKDIQRRDITANWQDGTNRRETLKKVRFFMMYYYYYYVSIYIYIYTG